VYILSDWGPSEDSNELLNAFGPDRPFFPYHVQTDEGLFPIAASAEGSQEALITTDRTAEPREPSTNALNDSDITENDLDWTIDQNGSLTDEIETTHFNTGLIPPEFWHTSFDINGPLSTLSQSDLSADRERDPLSDHIIPTETLAHSFNAHDSWSMEDYLIFSDSDPVIQQEALTNLAGNLLSNSHYDSATAPGSDNGPVQLPKTAFEMVAPVFQPIAPAPSMPTNSNIPSLPVRRTRRNRDGGQVGNNKYGRRGIRKCAQCQKHHKQVSTP
jgi:hypothetical protein